MYIPAQMLPNNQTIVERKLLGSFCDLHIKLPFEFYEEFAEHAQNLLRDQNINIDLVDIMENPLVLKQFESAVQSIASEVRFDDLDYVSPKIDLIYQNEIREAKRIREEEMQEAKRKAIAADEAQRLRATQATTAINVALENEAKARAILSLAGLL